MVDILPYIDQQGLYNSYNRNQPYYSTAVNGGTNNRTISSTGIGILSCPNDDTIVSGEGNLSYVVNSGFNRSWFSTNGWDSTAPPPRPATSAPIDWGQAAAKKTGLMWPGSLDGKQPWDYRRNLASHHRRRRHHRPPDREHLRRRLRKQPLRGRRHRRLAAAPHQQLGLLTPTSSPSSPPTTSAPWAVPAAAALKPRST